MSKENRTGEIGLFEEYKPPAVDKWIFLKEKCDNDPCNGQQLVRIYYIDGRYTTYCPGANHNG